MEGFRLYGYSNCSAVIRFQFFLILLNGYSQYAYDITAATQNSVIYPSLDPSIFEVRYPDTDIKGKVVPL